VPLEPGQLDPIGFDASARRRAGYPQGERRDRRVVLAGVLFATALTLLELLGFGMAMQRLIVRNKPPLASQVMRVDLLDALPLPAEPVPPERPERALPPQAQRQPPSSHSPPASRRTLPPPAQAAAPTTAATQAAPLRLFNADGSVALSPDALSEERRPAGKSTLRRSGTGIGYAPTRFESIWAPRDESLGDEAVRRSTFSHSWRLPGGTEIHCSVTLVLGMLGGCGWGRPPRLPIEELKRMRADPPMPRTKPADPQPPQPPAQPQPAQPEPAQ
jgi:hypothetical protein